MDLKHTTFNLVMELQTIFFPSNGSVVSEFRYYSFENTNVGTGYINLHHGVSQLVALIEIRFLSEMYSLMH